MNANKCTHGFELCTHDLCELECDTCEPSLAHEYACTCSQHGCPWYVPCSGGCGCGGCLRAYVDAMDGPS